jgi:hypothetical protein
MKKVVITHLSKDKDMDEVFTIVKRSSILIKTICQYQKELRKRGVEVYERRVNILRTSEGYYCAFFEEDVTKARKENSKEYPKPFKGFDGRLKVKLIDKNGDEVIEDLATLVAKSFVANPEDLPYVMFKDKDVNNCKADNLYWSAIK